MTNFQKLTEHYFEELYEQKALLISVEKIKLHHGGESHLYINHNQFLSHYDNLRLFQQLYVELLSSKTGSYTLGAVDSVMSPIFCGLLAGELHKNIVVIKEKKLAHGTQNQVFGETVGEVVLVDDVTSTGKILIDAATLLREKGVTVDTAIISACRDMTAIHNLNNAGIEAKYIASYEEIIRFLWKRLSPEEKAIINLEVTEKKYSWELL